MLTEYGLEQLAAEVHPINEAHGFWENGVSDDVIGTKLALIHSEVTEVLEAVRKNKGEKEVVKEMCDIFIRTLDLYAKMKDEGLITSSIDDIMEEVVENNRTRPFKHGHRF